MCGDEETVTDGCIPMSKPVANGGIVSASCISQNETQEIGPHDCRQLEVTETYTEGVGCSRFARGLPLTVRTR